MQSPKMVEMVAAKKAAAKKQSSYTRGMAGKSLAPTQARGVAAESRAKKAAATADSQGNLTKKNYNAMERGYAERDSANRTARDLGRIIGQRAGKFETNINKPSASVQKMLKKKK